MESIRFQVTGHTYVQELTSLDSFSKSHIALPFHVPYIILLQLRTLVGLYISCWEYKRMTCLGKAV